MNMMLFFLYEDIISFIQFNLLTNTQTKTIQNIEDFNFVFMKKNKYQNFAEIKKMNLLDINRFKLLKKNSDIYNAYKEKKLEKQKKEENEIEEIQEKEENKNKSLNNEDILSRIMKTNPQMAMMKEIREKEKRENERRQIVRRTNRSRSIISSNSSITANNENEDDFFSDVKITGLNDNIEKNKRKKRQEKLEKLKKKTFDIEELLMNDEKTEDIMKEIEQEQKKWEEKINSSASSFSITSSIKENNNNEYKINIFKFNEMNEKEKKHIIREKKLENKIENAQRLLKNRDLVSSKTREKLNKERLEKGESNGTSDTMSEASYLSFLSKNQRYPF